MKYWALFADSYEDGAILSCIPSDGPKVSKYNKAKSLKDVFPGLEDAVMCFDPNYTDCSVLYDFMDCLDSVLVISGKSKSVFEAEGVTEEFLRVRLWDHNDQTVSDDYYIFNCLELVDFIDMDRSTLAMDPTFPDRVQRTENLVVKQDIPGEYKVFCPINMKNQIFISDDFKQSLEAAGISGVKTFEAEGWDGLDV